MFEGLDLHEIYSLITRWIFLSILFMIIILIIIKFKFNIKFFKELTKFSQKYNKTLTYSVMLIILILIIVFFAMIYINYKLDISTKVHAPEKIVIIEIDDYWNINDTESYFSPYGYSMENYRAISDILDKYEYSASLGVTPFIFAEQVRKNFPLEDDSKMIAYLNELREKDYEICMHGYNHCLNENYCPKYEEVYFNILDGKLKLEEIFNEKIITYLPPGNSWTTEQYNNVKDTGFLIIANTHVPIAYFDEKIIITQKGYDPIYHYGWYQVDFRHTDYTEWIKAYEKEENFFILQLHCNTFNNQKKLEDLNAFLKYLKENNAKVVTYKQAYSMIIEDTELYSLSSWPN